MIAPEDLIADQIDYYRQRAPAYDDWWQRTGTYDWGAEEAAEWKAQVERAAAGLETFSATGRVLELAGGTGWWTQRLARTAGALTVVDASAETLELNRRRVGRPDVDYRVADLFAWQPEDGETWDAVVFTFWLSHVPPEWFDRFWALVRRCLARGGRCFFVDNRNPGAVRPDVNVLGATGPVETRRLGDGSIHRVVKCYYEPSELEGRLADLGRDAHVDGSRLLIWGSVA